MSEALLAAASRALGVGIERASAVGGGDINAAWRLELDDGTAAFLKSRPDAPADEFGAEAAGLAWLGEAGGLPVPEVLAVIEEGDVRGLALAWIDPGRLRSDGEELLGRGLALTHEAGAAGFDALPPGSPRRALRFGGVEVPVASAATWVGGLRRPARGAERGSRSIAAGSRPPAALPSRPSAAASPIWRGRPSLPRGSTATSGAATSTPAPTGGRG